MPDTDSMLSFQTFFFFVFLQIVVPRRSVQSSAAIVIVPRRSERSILVAAVTAVVPHGASKLTFSQQRAGGGAGGDADGGVAAAEATYRLPPSEDARIGKRRGGREHDIRIKIGAIKIYQYIESNYGLPIFLGCVTSTVIIISQAVRDKKVC